MLVALQISSKRKTPMPVGHPPTYLHLLPGRVRMKIPALKHATSEAQTFETQLRAMHPELTEVTVNSTTGNVLVQYDEQALTAQDVLATLTHLSAALPQHSNTPPLSTLLARMMMSTVAEQLCGPVFGPVLQHAVFAGL
jgi:hypothetical protein